MQHKLTFLFAALILLSLAVAPASPADAQAGRQASGSARVNTSNPVFCPVAGEQPVNVFFLKTLEIFFEPYFSSIYRGFARLSPCIRGV